MTTGERDTEQGMSNPKYKVVQLRMSVAELERIKAIAKQAKVTPSQAVNVMLAAYMVDQKDTK